MIKANSNRRFSTSNSPRAPDFSPANIHQQSHSRAMSGEGTNYYPTGQLGGNDLLYRQSQSSPVFIAPNPLSRRVSATLHIGHDQPRHHLMPSLNMSLPVPRSQGSEHSVTQRALTSKPKNSMKVKRRKSLTKEQFDKVVGDRDIKLHDWEYHLLVLERELPKLPWKVILQRFNQAENLDLNEATLQMRYKRLVDNLLVRIFILLTRLQHISTQGEASVSQDHIEFTTC